MVRKASGSSRRRKSRSSPACRRVSATMIMVALTRRQAGLLRDFLRREDPEAFLTIVNSSEIIGKGFQSI